MNKLNQNIKIIKMLLREFIDFIETHEVGALTRDDFKTWVYLEKSDDE